MQYLRPPFIARPYGTLDSFKKFNAQNVRYFKNNAYLCSGFLNITLMSTQMNKAIADYFKTQPIERAWLFGSFARGEETPISDVDILVQFDEDGVSLLKHAAMICELEKILDRPVDIVPEKALRPRVRESINQDKKLIYERTR